MYKCDLRLRACVAVCKIGQQSQSSSSAGTGGAQNSSSSGSLPSNLSYTSYILKQTPQVGRHFQRKDL